ncbi:MAG: DUF4149 domain-containing protein [Acidobacteriota bacterium]|nr:DUF4149 domain-containing protein [Acidobacteriota bacterium]
MPNWFYLFFNALYHLGLALWIGGSIALGALVAPALFRSLPRYEAGGIFGPILRRFARLRVAALVMIVAGAGAKFLRWETHAATPWLVIRWIAITVLAFDLVYEIVFLEKPMQALRAGLGPDVPADDPGRLRFNALHRRAEGLMKASIVAAFVALLFS